VMAKFDKTCSNATISVELKNASKETLDGVSFGWTFPPISEGCPAQISEKRTIGMRLSPGETGWTRINIFDGPLTLQSRLCLAITGVRIEPLGNQLNVFGTAR
jgi:hypothetical protein